MRLAKQHLRIGGWRGQGSGCGEHANETCQGRNIPLLEEELKKQCRVSARANNFAQAARALSLFSITEIEAAACAPPIEQKPPPAGAYKKQRVSRARGLFKSALAAIYIE